MSKTQPTHRTRLIRAGIATVAATASLAATTISPAYAAAVALTLSSATGPSGSSTTTITASASTPWLTGITAPVVTLSLPACQTTYNTTASTAVTPTSASVGNVLGGVATKISNTKAAILLPSLLVMPTTASTTKYNVCVYTGNTTSDTLIGSGNYSVAAASTVSSVLPASGPALGGSQITVTGTSFPTTAGSITATLGGTPLTNVTPISTTSFTAVTPYHPSGSAAIGVTTAAGTVTLQNAFTYSNGIVISPNTASSAVATSTNPVYVDVLGSSFLAMTFSASYTNSTTPVVGTGALNKAQVFLVKGAYSANTAAATTYTNGPQARCASVVVISDTELICSLDLATGAITASTGVAASSAVPDGTYTLTVVSNGASGTSATNDPLAAAATTPTGILVSDISSGSTFTVAPY
jgi:hypothetical protein